MRKLHHSIWLLALLAGSSSLLSAHESVVEVTASGLNVRSGPSTKYGKIGFVRRPQAYVKVATSGAWQKIWYSGRTAWVHGRYTKAATREIARVTASSLNVRRGPGTGYGRVGRIPRASLWAIVGSKGKWRKIHFKGAARWVHSAYLGDSGGGSSPAPAPAPAPKGDLPKSSVGFVNLPPSGPGFYTYQKAYRRWGRPGMIYGLMRAADSWRAAHPTYPRIGIGDLSRKLGGKFSPHVTHREGKDADIRPVARTAYEGPLTVSSGSYSSERTRTWFVSHLVKHAPVYRILYNDSKIYKSLSYVRYYKGHHNHHHADFK